jgi:hypothetical protein
MSATPYQPKFASAGLNPKGQTLEHVNQIVADIAGRAGCGRCGRIALLRVEFLSDPPPELGKLNVTTYVQNGIAAG